MLWLTRSALYSLDHTSNLTQEVVKENTEELQRRV